MHLISLTTALAAVTAIAQAYFVSIDANSEDCFLENVTIGTKMTLTFEVAEGGFLDIDVKVTAPDGSTVYSGERESNGKYTFTAAADGSYKYCFGNQMSSMTPKVLMFTMELGAKPKDFGQGDDESHNQLAGAVNQLAEGLLAIKHEQEFMEVRERVHRTINDNTNSRVVLWAFFEALVLISMVLGQVYYLKRFFEVRRVI